jgi:hypothetical protein
MTFPPIGWSVSSLGRRTQAGELAPISIPIGSHPTLDETGHTLQHIGFAKTGQENSTIFNNRLTFDRTHSSTTRWLSGKTLNAAPSVPIQPRRSRALPCFALAIARMLEMRVSLSHQ